MEFAGCPLNSASSTYTKVLERHSNVSTEKDNLRCTFFRQPKHTFWAEIPPFVPRSEGCLSHNFSDTCIESDDDQMNSTPDSRTNSSSLYTIDNQIPPAGRKAAKVTFGKASYISLDRNVKSLLKGDENGFRKMLQRRKDYLRLKLDLKNKKYFGKSCTMRLNRYENKRRILRENIFTKCKRKDDDTHEHPGILRGGKMGLKIANTIWQDEGTKKKNLIENRILRNKRLLKSMEEIIHEMSKEETSNQKRLASVQSTKPENKPEEADMTKTEEEEENQKNAANDPIDTDRILKKPIFKKLELEKMLDDSMHRAVLKYRTRTNTWNTIIKGQS